MELLKKLKANDDKLGYYYILPSLMLVMILITYPIFRGLYLSFFETNLVNKFNFVGLKHYFGILTNSAFYKSVFITLKFCFFVVIGHFIIGFLLAHILSKELKGILFFRAIFIMPWLIPESVIAMIFKWLFNPLYGLVNNILLGLSIIDEPISWLGSSSSAFFVVVLVSIWKGFPMIMIMMLAGMQSVPQSLYDASSLDGASSWQQFRHITIPGIKPVLATALILDTVWWFKHFTTVWVLTQGGPGGATGLISIEIFKTSFEYFRFGKASAMAILVFFVCLVIGEIYERILKIKEE